MNYTKDTANIDEKKVGPSNFAQLTPDTSSPTSNLHAKLPGTNSDSVAIDIQEPPNTADQSSKVPLRNTPSTPGASAFSFQRAIAPGAVRVPGPDAPDAQDDEDEGTISGNTTYSQNEARVPHHNNAIHVAELVDQERERRAIVEGAKEEIQNEILLNAPLAEAVPDNLKGFWTRRSILCFVFLAVAVIVASVGAAVGVSRSKQSATSSPPTASPTLTPSSELETKTLFTTLEYTHSFYGHMFDLTASTNISIISMDIHMSSTDPELIEIWTKEGEYHDFETNSFRWAKLGEETVTGMGSNALTPLPQDLFDPVRVNAGERRAFYVTAQTEIIYFQERMGVNGSLIDYGQPTEFANEDLQINVGTGIQYKFENNGPPNIFNGAIHYAVV